MQHFISVIINFCSNEKMFLPFCVQQAQKFASQIIVPVADHFFNGEREKEALLKKTFAKCPGIEVVLYPFLKTLPLPAASKDHIWHNLSRLVGFSQVFPETEYVLFLDADEIAEGQAFKEWLDTREYQNYAALKLFTYWYFREPSLQAKTLETSPLLLQKKKVTPSLLLQKDERSGMFTQLKAKKKEGLPIPACFHHFSWVRDKQTMLQKVQSWGHKQEQDWTALVEKEFAGSFTGQDFVHGYEYKKVQPVFDFSQEFPEYPEGFSLKKLSDKKLLSLLPGFFWEKSKKLFQKAKNPLLFTH